MDDGSSSLETGTAPVGAEFNVKPPIEPLNAVNPDMLQALESQLLYPHASAVFEQSLASLQLNLTSREKHADNLKNLGKIAKNPADFIAGQFSACEGQFPEWNIYMADVIRQNPDAFLYGTTDLEKPDYPVAIKRPGESDTEVVVITPDGLFSYQYKDPNTRKPYTGMQLASYAANASAFRTITHSFPDHPYEHYKTKYRTASRLDSPCPAERADVTVNVIGSAKYFRQEKFAASIREDIAKITSTPPAPAK